MANQFTKVAPTVEERFWNKVDRSGECWLWIGYTANGYGKFRWQGAQRLAHRVAYIMLVGPIPEGLFIDHLCRVRHCVNPSHMELVTQKENTHRGVAPSNLIRLSRHCTRGHPYTPEHGYYLKSKPTSWDCATCRKVRDAARGPR